MQLFHLIQIECLNCFRQPTWRGTYHVTVAADEAEGNEPVQKLQARDDLFNLRKSANGGTIVEWNFLKYQDIKG